VEVIEEEKLLENAHTVGAYFRQKLEELQQKHPSSGRAADGADAGLELVKDRKTKEPAVPELAQLMERTKENGLLIGKGGLMNNVVRLSPPLNISKADVDEGIRLLDKSFAEIR
jgi:4-aminobutyrate aminotransferase-like enzyme